jgi:hypothetical protein
MTESKWVGDGRCNDAEHQANCARIREVSKGYGRNKALESGKREGTKVFERLASSYANIKSESLMFTYHMGGFKAGFLAGGAS